MTELKQLDPKPLLNGEDIIALGVETGRAVGNWLAKAYEIQVVGNLNRDTIITTLKKEIETWLKIRPAAEKKVSISTMRKNELKKYMSKYDFKDLRFIYFRSKSQPGIYITAVSILEREKCTLKVVFSFSSPKDDFCRRAGKITCFKKLEEENNGHVVTVPWLDDGLLSVFLAYNRLKEKPEKLAKTKFDDLIYANCQAYALSDGRVIWM